MTTLHLLIGIACSVAIVVWLWHGDAKRRRVAGLLPIAISSDKRRIMAIAALLPGVIFAVLGDSAGVLIWLGSCAMGGWIVSQFATDE